MNPEFFRVRMDQRRLIVVIADQQRAGRIGDSLRDVGCSEAGPCAWVCGIDVSMESLSGAVGELLSGEVVYLAAQGAERLDLGLFVAPNTEGGIIVQ
ncbi:hypothetical protein [Sphingosinicella sp. BN140058]|uniref:hypothetical protein n=1 Tax=Sphingosinicella sp. BN140058 TaxID=1892855 RepID=UPI0010136394|nr:hypothetical protein [Sphingosinicella sp. BN140058]QAY75617.1 hypothetical protein ETR14_03040 [Sphingosinicella sp. BN140058]